MTTNPRNTRSAWTLAPVLALALVATPLLAGEPAGAKASPAAAGPWTPSVPWPAPGRGPTATARRSR